MDYQPDVATHAHGPEIFIFHLVELVKAHAGIGGIDLQVESCCLYSLLLIAGQTGEAISERVGNAKFHRRKTSGQSILRGEGEWVAIPVRNTVSLEPTRFTTTMDLIQGFCFV